MNAEFEDDAEHEDMAFVRDHPELEREPRESEFQDDYGPFGTPADLFRQIGDDERLHKAESLVRLEAPRFS